MSRNWDVSSDRIAGTELRDVRNIITGNGITAELFRQDWAWSTPRWSRSSTCRCGRAR
ncbi:MAG TPA: hypothetical protein VH231_06615 [Solirubrobacteraceae bacterium]|nr:hypothetical protein [Solirubrobacteraceae bacterium]